MANREACRCASCKARDARAFERIVARNFKPGELAEIVVRAATNQRPMVDRIADYGFVKSL